MNKILGSRYYNMALARAKMCDLSGAVQFARRALYLDTENGNARRLLGLCLYEIGDLRSAGDALAETRELIASVYAAQENTKEILTRVQELSNRKKWRKAEALSRTIKHQSVRILNIRGCLCAARGRYKDAAALFSQALEKDRGNKLALDYLQEVVGRRKGF